MLNINLHINLIHLRQIAENYVVKETAESTSKDAESPPENKRTIVKCRLGTSQDQGEIRRLRHLAHTERATHFSFYLICSET